MDKRPRGAGAGAANSRWRAAHSVQQVLAGQSLDSALEPRPGDTEPGSPASVDPLARALAYTVLRHRTLLETVLKGYLRKPLRARDEDLRCLLLTGLAELSWFATPAHAVVDETVSATRLLDKAWARGLVNAVLRSHQRAGPPDPETLMKGRPELSIRHSHPQWLVALITQAWPDLAPEILVENNRQAPMTLRVNQSRISRADYLAQLSAAAMDGRATDLSGAGVVLGKAISVNDLPGFADGLVSVQDEAAQLAATLLGPAPGMKVLDACAAPGGKTAHLKELEPDLNLTAIDIDPERCKQIVQNLTRLQLEANVIAADAMDLTEAGFDRILLDAPCSATGVIRRHPDIKWLRRAADIERLTGLQQQLLRHLWSRLKCGGRLLYATCSLLPAENHLTIERFTGDQADARVLPLALSAGCDTGYGTQLLPGQDGTDGFFYALLEKS